MIVAPNRGRSIAQSTGEDHICAACGTGDSVSGDSQIRTADGGAARRIETVDERMRNDCATQTSEEGDRYNYVRATRQTAGEGHGARRIDPSQVTASHSQRSEVPRYKRRRRGEAIDLIVTCGARYRRPSQTTACIQSACRTHLTVKCACVCVCVCTACVRTHHPPPNQIWPSPAATPMNVFPVANAPWSTCVGRSAPNA